MENFKKQFEKLLEKYNKKKEPFQKRVELWKKHNKKKAYQTGNQLIQETENVISKLKEYLTSTAEQQPNEKLIKTHIKMFKKLYKQINEQTKSTLRQWVEAIIVAGTFVFILRTFVFGLYHVPTGSAEPTILVGDRIWGNKMSYYLSKVKHGDCVIFDNPEFIYDKSSYINYLWQKYIGFPIPILGLKIGPDNWVKRVIAIPGDLIEGRIEDGKTIIYRNGKKLDETSYVNPYPLIKLAKTTGFINISNFGPFMIPSFIRKNTKIVDYTYDPSKSFENQSFYNMKPNEIIRKADGRPMLKMPYTPTYEFSPIQGEYGRSVDSFGPIKIPEGKYWVMGDSRKNSRDSRFWGFLDQDLIHGKASFIIFSVDSEEPIWIFELLKHPINFWTKSIRWNRFLKNIK
ncbi:signal peptidase I [Candidatus Dependentiae bacterium]|nr:signal peptidase I [Candidatus Dependentiae bacterium]